MMIRTYLSLLKSFIENQDEEGFFLILNALKKELRNNSLKAA